MRRTWTTRTFLVRVVQTSSLNASSSQAHCLLSTGHQGRKRELSTAADPDATARYNKLNRPERNSSRSQLRGS
jgi:hypothetical protein